MKLKQPKWLKWSLNLSALAFSSLLAAQVSAAPEQRFIVKYKDAKQTKASTAVRIQSMQESLAASSGLSLKHVRALALADRHVFKFDKRYSKVEFQTLLNKLRKNPNVLSVQEDALMQPNRVPNDTLYSDQWHYFEATGGMNAEAAWDTHDGTGVVVAVLDTGITDHSDLNANVLPGYDFIIDTDVSNDGDGRDSDASDPGDWVATFECGFNAARNSSWHGTHVAGTIAAVTDNGQGVAGVAYGAQILPVRVLGKCGGFLSDIADAIVWASGGSVAGVPDNTTPAQIINMSLGGSSACDSTYQDAIDIAVANGTTVVVSAGNSDDDANNYRPASCDDVISVAANDQGGNKAWYSNWGSAVDVTAPGGETAIAEEGVLSALNDGTQSPGNEAYAYYQGTSMAAPHVAGAAALLYQANPSITPAEVEATLMSTARPLPGDCVNGCGAGIIDARAALDSLGSSNLVPTSSFTFSANELEVTFTDASTDSDGTIASWSWNFGDGNSSTSQNPVHTYAAGGTYDVTLTVTDNEGATDDSTQSVTVSEAGNNPPIADFGYTANDLEVSFTDLSTDSDGTIASWSWDFGDGNSSTAQNPVHTFGAAGDYDVMLTATDDQGTSDSTMQTITVTAGTDPTSGGFTETGIDVARRQIIIYTIEVPAGAESLEISTTGGTGNVDLAVNFGSTPTRQDNDCIDRGPGNEESCTFTNPQAGTWYIALRGNTPVNDTQLDAYWHDTE